MTAGTAVERQADVKENDDLKSILAEALAESEPEEQEKEVVETTPENTEPQDNETIGDEEAEKEEAPKEDAEPEAEIKKIEAPESWPQEERELFSKLPDDLKERYLDRQKSIQADATKKWEEAASIKREYEPLKQVLEPYKAVLAREGFDTINGVNRLMTVWSNLQQAPEQTIKELCRVYNVSLDSIVQEDAYKDPDIAKLEREVTELKTREEADKAEKNRVVLQERSHWVEEFATAKDATGAPLYPEFPTLIEDMKPYLRFSPTREDAMNVMRDAYEKAQWANKTHREKLLATKAKSDIEKKITEDKAKAAKARKAGHSIASGQGSNIHLVKDDKNIRSILEELI